MHAQMIYADSTNDGPEIGTLVVVVDRAKNLPNRKSTKQDPYCQGRLGKTCNKTKTDKRGGQTPRW
jgi:C2 domain